MSYYCCPRGYAADCYSPTPPRPEHEHLVSGYFGYASTSPTGIAGGENISFNQSSAVNRLDVPIMPASQITIEESGVYRLGYGVLYSNASNSTVVIRVNGVDLGIGVLNVVVENNGEVSGEIIVNLSAGDVISLGINGTSITLTSIGTSAYLTIFRL